jgi:type IV secretory pathway component VirB8
MLRVFHSNSPEVCGPLRPGKSIRPPRYDCNQQDGDIDVEIKQVAIEDLRSAPYKATVDFEMVYYSPVDRSVTRRVFYTANFVFYFRDTVPNELVPVNPLGLAITYFREDQAFGEPNVTSGNQP